MIQGNIYLGSAKSFSNMFEHMFAPSLLLFIFIGIGCSRLANYHKERLDSSDHLSIAKKKGVAHVFKMYCYSRYFLSFMNLIVITSDTIFFSLLVVYFTIQLNNFKQGIDSFEYNHCSIHSECSKGTNNTIDYVKYVYDINDKVEHCLNLASSYHGEMNLLWYYEINENFPTNNKGQSECYQSDLGCCSIFSTCESYTKPIGLVFNHAASYSKYDNIIRWGYPHGYVTSEQPKIDEVGSNCMTDKELIEYYIEHQSYTYSDIIYMIATVYAIQFYIFLLFRNIFPLKLDNLPRKSIIDHGINRLYLALFSCDKEYKQTQTEETKTVETENSIEVP